MKALGHVLRNAQVQMLLITISVALFISATSSFSLASRL